ncbi:MAG: putative toxin-antitoxin system toxin component, PIN family [Cytophagales bacterium]|nr:putative toxin-antitoxin system toxin component, PIN family [Cytophagales bacterium]
MSLLAVIDTNIFVGACLGVGATNRVIASAIEGHFRPVMGSALFHEHEDVLSRESLLANSKLTRKERDELFDIFISKCQWTRVYFGWRPNLPDEGDNHLIELAVAAGASYVVTKNLKHVSNTDLKFKNIQVVSPQKFLKELSL